MSKQENILLMMPKFMEYETVLIKALTQYGKVTYFNNERHLADLEGSFKKSIVKKVLKKIFSALNKKYYLYEYFLRKYNKEDLSILLVEKYSIIININGSYLSDKIYKILQKHNNEAEMILYWWDDAENLLKKNYESFFKKKYSYCIDDCEKYGFKYLQMFTPIENMVLCENKEYDIAVIGTAHPDRVELAKKIYKKYREDYNIYIFLYHPTKKIEFFGHNTPLSFKEYIEILSKSKAVMDLPFLNQMGPTTRPFDALSTNTKVITTNKEISKYPIYSENILIIDRDNPVIDATFINSPYIKTGKKYLGVDDWVRKIL